MPQAESRSVFHAFALFVGVDLLEYSDSLRFMLQDWHSRWKATNRRLPLKPWQYWRLQRGTELLVIERCCGVLTRSRNDVTPGGKPWESFVALQSNNNLSQYTFDPRNLNQLTVYPDYQRYRLFTA
jgi:hypothetical protein